ncbi:hypothetical protein Tco_0139951 [Tanacetum coccineum]
MFPEPDYTHDDSNFYGCAGLRLAFDLTKSPDNRLVHAGSNSYEIVIPIYSSEICNWSLCRKQFTYLYFVHFDSAIYWNDALHWLETENSDFTIYEMTKGCSVWLIKYIVDTNDFMTPLPEGWSIWYIFWSLVLGEIEEDSFLVINLSGKAVQYNLISKTLREIYDMGSNEVTDDYLHGFIPPFSTYDMGYKKLDHEVYEFIPSSASV